MCCLIIYCFGCKYGFLHGLLMCSYSHHDPYFGPAVRKLNVIPKYIYIFDIIKDKLGMIFYGCIFPYVPVCSNKNVLKNLTQCNTENAVSSS